MTAKVRIKTTDANSIHFDTWANNYTLCGLEKGGDKFLGIDKGVIVKSKVNCPHCIKIVEFCHKIKKNEFV